ncbi:MAG: hypothetical protein FWF43_08390 [Propionibacteriaceae bacterium]|nr:hypothetical protein [Propionibacteriaceae bacterium]
MSLFTNEFLIQVAAGLLVAILTGLISPHWAKRPDRHASGSPPVSSALPGTDGINVSSSGENTTIRIRQDDHSTRKIKNTTKTVTNYPAPPNSHSSDDIATVILAVLGAFLVSAIFLIWWPIVRAFLIGAVLGVVIMLVVAIVRTTRAPEKLLKHAIPAGLLSALGCGTAVITAIQLSKTSRGGVSLSSVLALAGPVSDEQRTAGLTGYVSYFTRNILPTVGGHLSFVTFQATAVTFAALVLWICRGWILDWHSFLQYSGQASQPKRTVQRAKAFKKPLRGNVAAVLIGIAMSIAMYALAYTDWPQSISIQLH